MTLQEFKSGPLSKIKILKKKPHFERTLERLARTINKEEELLKHASFYQKDAQDMEDLYKKFKDLEK